MSGTITRIGMTSAGALLAIGLFAAPPAGAKSSQRDEQAARSHTAACFDETGQTQGRSHSDPDGMRNGGFDKPGCRGGFDSDRDGNNGCGNDADREDDNNGRCGRDAEPSGSSSTTSTTTGQAVDDDELSASSVGAGSVGDGSVATGTAAGTGPTTDVEAADAGADDTAPGDADSTATEPTTTVLGETLERPGTLPRTGAGVAGLTLLGGLLCGGGRLAVLARRFMRIG